MPTRFLISFPLNKFPTYLLNTLSTFIPQTAANNFITRENFVFILADMKAKYFYNTYVTPSIQQTTEAATFPQIALAICPPKVTGLSVIDFGTDFVSLIWDDIIPSVSLYEVERSTDNINWTAIAWPTSSNFTDNTVSSGTTYYYRIKGVDLCSLASCNKGRGNPSNSVSVTTIAVPILYGNNGRENFVLYPGHSLYTIDPNNASVSSSLFQWAPGIDDKGESLAWNSDNGFLYRITSVPRDTPAGVADFRKLDVDTFTPTTISTSGALITHVTALTYQGSGVFLFCTATNFGTPDKLCSVTTAGVITELGALDAGFNTYKGLAFLGGTLYAVGPLSDQLRILNPTNGLIISTVTITVPITPVIEGHALTVYNGQLFGCIMLNSPPFNRHLVQIDPITGIGVDKGTFPVNMSGFNTLNISALATVG